jgi:prefoldin subunit 5
MKEEEIIEEYLVLSKQIKNCADNLVGLGIKKSLTPENNLGKERDKFLEKIKELDNKILTIIGQMYKGVLITDDLSIREDGLIYEYRRQYKPICRTVLKSIVDNLNEVELRVGKPNADLIKELHRLHNLAEELHEKLGKIENAHIQFEEPITLVSVREYDRNNIILVNISGINVSYNGKVLEDVNQEKLYDYGCGIIIEKKFKNEIEEVSKKMLNEIKDLNKGVTEIINTVEGKGAKYLIASTFKAA